MQLYVFYQSAFEGTLHMLPTFDYLFVSAAFTIILRKNQHLACKGTMQYLDLVSQQWLQRSTVQQASV